MKHPLLRAWSDYHQPPRIDDADDARAFMLSTGADWRATVEDGGHSIESVIAREDLWWAYVDLLDAERDVFRWRTAIGYILLMLAAVVGWAILTGGM